MNLEKLYKLQAKLDQHIIEKHKIKMSKEELLDNAILALLVEVGELANTTRCFKHWSTKGMMEKEVVLDELADVWHFYLSIGNQIEYVKSEFLAEEKYNKVMTELHIYEERSYESIITETFTTLYQLGYRLSKRNLVDYNEFGVGLQIIQYYYDFTDEEVEQAYLKKHRENYRRQEEGY